MANSKYVSDSRISCNGYDFPRPETLHTYWRCRRSSIRSISFAKDFHVPRSYLSQRICVLNLPDEREDDDVNDVFPLVRIEHRFVHPMRGLVALLVAAETIRKK